MTIGKAEILELEEKRLERQMELESDEKMQVQLKENKVERLTEMERYKFDNESRGPVGSNVSLEQFKLVPKFDMDHVAEFSDAVKRSRKVLGGRRNGGQRWLGSVCVCW